MRHARCVEVRVAASEHVDDRLTQAMADNAVLRTQLAEREQQIAERDRQIAHLTKMLFAKKSERLADENHPKLPLDWGACAANAAARRRGRRRRVRGDHLQAEEARCNADQPGAAA